MMIADRGFEGIVQTPRDIIPDSAPRRPIPLTPPEHVVVVPPLEDSLDQGAIVTLIKRAPLEWAILCGLDQGDNRIGPMFALRG